MNIRISSIKIHVISHLGSLNIGKTILTRNTAMMTRAAVTEDTEGPPGVSDRAGDGNRTPPDPSAHRPPDDP